MTTIDRVEVLIRTLGLEPHPEGGHFRQVYRSASIVRPADGRGDRAALTTIYYVLLKGEVAAWHRVHSDEVWHFCEGDPLELTWLDTEARDVGTYLLGPVAENQAPMAVIPAGWWQSARTLGTYTLVGCTVGPGFEYADWELTAPSGD